MSRRPAPLPAGMAVRTLAHRLAARADRLRQLNTRFGLRSSRVFLVHTKTDGEERGEGTERIIRRIELLPTPRVMDLTVINQRPWSGGTLPEGSIRIDQISVNRYTTDMLQGTRFAPAAYAGPRHGPTHSAEVVGGDNDAPEFDSSTDFFYEIVSDDRDDRPTQRNRFRLLGDPWLNEGSLSWGILVEAASEPMNRDGDPDLSDEDL